METLDRLRRGLTGRYDIQRLLGEGGMAQVYLAEDLKHHRPVALKVLRPDLSAAVGTERFLREIDLAAGLNHPNILALHDSGEADGLLYFVMPYVDGGSLRARLDRDGPLPLDEALRIAEEMGSALDYAHERGLVHRDIKPENILFQAGHALVADLGIAQVAREEGERLTRTGFTVGTFTYMSPEQLTGDGGVDARSDLYALGCVLHEMLSGRPPFQAPTAQASLARKLTGELENVAEGRGDLPPTLHPVLRRCLAVEPEDRYATARALVAELRGATTRSAVEADARRKRRRGILRNAGVAALVLALGAGGWFARQAMDGPLMNRIAVLPLENAAGNPEQEYFVAGAYAELVVEMSKALLVTARGSAEAVAREGLRVRDVARELGVDGVVTGRVSVDPDSVSITLELIDGESEEILWSQRFQTVPRQVVGLYRQATLAIADRIQMRLSQETRSRLAQTQEVDPRVYNALLQAQFNWRKLTAEGFDTAEDYYRQAIELSDSTSAEAWWGLSRIPSLRAQMGLITGADALAQGEEPARRARELGIDVAAQQGGFGAWSDWKFEEAEALFRRSLELDPTDAVKRVYFAHVLLYRGKEEEAVQQAHRAAADDPYNSLVLGIYGQFLNFVHRYEEAEAAFRLALEREPNDPISLSNFRTTYHLEGRFEEAIPLWRDYYIRVSRDTLAVDALNRGYARGGYPEALRAVAEEFVSREDPRLNWQIATLYTRAGDTEGALEYLEKATEVRDPNMPYIIVDPIFDFMRDEPRFQALLDTLRAAQ